MFYRFTYKTTSVSREELEKGSDISQSDGERLSTQEELEDAIKHRYADFSGMNTSDGHPVTEVNAEKGGILEDETFEFRLFATSKPSKLVVDNIEGDLGDGGLVGGGRRSEYYQWSRQTGVEKRREEFRETAVDGDTIKAWSERKCTGWTMPWRVVSINSTEKAAETPAIIRDNGRRKKPSKKHRIIIQNRAAEANLQKQREAEALKSREEAEREKKTRRNREKKVKRKIKEKAKKVEILES